MLNPKLQAALNAQINMEMSAYYTYLSMSAYFEGLGLKGFAGWMFHHSEEEMLHAMKIYRYVHERRGQVTLQALPAPTNQWETPEAAVKDALHHEEKVTASINALMDLAREERDHATESFLKWFVDEQVEEEAVVDEVLQKLSFIGDFRAGLYMLDRELAQATSAEAEGEAAAE